MLQPVGIVALGVIQTVVNAATLLAGQGSSHNRMGQIQHLS
jgi:hypothetical protein